MTATSPLTQRLIPSDERTKFVALYLFTTIIPWVLFGTFFSLSSIIPNTILRVTLEAIVTGLMVGIGQWLVLRSYFPGWLWIVVTVIGSGLVTLTQNLWYFSLLRTIEQPESNSFLEIFLNTPLNIILPVQGMTILAFCLWFAGAQWLVLRQYVMASAWWLLTPAIAMLLSWTILILQLVFLFSVVLQQQVLLPGLIAAVQALMLCGFWRKESAFTEEAESQQRSDVGGISLLGLAIVTFVGVLVLSLSIQGFLIWFHVP